MTADAPRSSSDFAEGHCQVIAESNVRCLDLEGPVHQKSSVAAPWGLNDFVEGFAAPWGLNDFVEGYCQARLEDLEHQKASVGVLRGSNDVAEGYC